MPHTPTIDVSDRTVRASARSIKSEVRSWYETYEPLRQLSFPSAWRRVPKNFHALRVLGGLDAVEDRQLQVIAWIGTALTTSSWKRTSRERDLYAAKRKALRQARAAVEKANTLVDLWFPSVVPPLLQARKKIQNCEMVLVVKLGHVDPAAGKIPQFLLAAEDLVLYLLMRILVKGSSLNQAKAEVQTARMARIFGFEVEYKTLETGGRWESPKVRARIKRFRDSPGWRRCSPWQILLLDTLGVVPDHVPAGAPHFPQGVKEVKAIDESSWERSLAGKVLLTAHLALNTDIKLHYKGLIRDLERHSRELIEFRTRVDQYAKAVERLESEGTRSVVAEKRKLMDVWRANAEEYERVARRMRLARQAYGSPVRELASFPELKELLDHSDR